MDESDSNGLTITLSSKAMAALSGLCQREDAFRRFRIEGLSWSSAEGSRADLDITAVVEAIVDGLGDDLRDMLRGIEKIVRGGHHHDAGIAVLRVVAETQEARARRVRALLDTYVEHNAGTGRSFQDRLDYASARRLVARMLNIEDLADCVLRPDEAQDDAT